MAGELEPVRGPTSDCFVVMPFGKKAVPGGGGTTYDFDKLYRVVIKRAIDAAGLRPLRADEKTSSGPIHADMFKALRDHKVVLADLSLSNPNVFYELGIRHVLASSGTVLMCRSGQPLPFDVALSRAVIYSYDGVNLDWEEAERLVPLIRQFLIEAQQGLKDSPVHAFISVPVGGEASLGVLNGVDSNAKELDPYQRELGERWLRDGKTLEALRLEHGRSVFGARAVGHFCLAQDPLPPGSAEHAAHLVDMAQYGLANELFSRLHGTGLGYYSLLTYASSLSEERPNLTGANEARALVEEAFSVVDRTLPAGSESEGERMHALAACQRRLAGLQQWTWQLTREEQDLDAAIAELATALEQMQAARQMGAWDSIGLIAQAHVKLLLLLRLRDDDIDRVDVEEHAKAVLGIDPITGTDDEWGKSYLRWYQALLLADAGNETASRQKALAALREDAKLTDPKYIEIGNRQYILLRRFIEQYSSWLRHPSLMGILSQLLQPEIV